MCTLNMFFGRLVTCTHGTCYPLFTLHFTLMKNVSYVMVTIVSYVSRCTDIDGNAPELHPAVVLHAKIFVPDTRQTDARQSRPGLQHRLYINFRLRLLLLVGKQSEFRVFHEQTMQWDMCPVLVQKSTCGTVCTLSTREVEAKGHACNTQCTQPAWY